MAASQPPPHPLPAPPVPPPSTSDVIWCPSPSWSNPDQSSAVNKAVLSVYAHLSASLVITQTHSDLLRLQLLISFSVKNYKKHIQQVKYHNDKVQKQEL